MAVEKSLSLTFRRLQSDAGPKCWVSVFGVVLLAGEGKLPSPPGQGVGVGVGTFPGRRMSVKSKPTAKRLK